MGKITQAACWNGVLSCAGSRAESTHIELELGRYARDIDR